MPVRPYDARVTDIDDATSDEATKPPPPDATPATASPGERRLARPPSDRYREAEAAAAAAEADAVVDPAASVARGVALAAAVAIMGAAAIVFLGGVLEFTEVLLVIAGFTGGGVGIVLRWGAGVQLARRHRIV